MSLDKSEKEVMHELHTIINKLTNNLENKTTKVSKDKDKTITILDIYEMLTETNNQLTRTLNNFRHNLEKSDDNISVNHSILKFTRDFYKIRTLLKNHSKVYNNIEFSHLNTAKIGEKYVETCLSKENRDKCLSNLAT